MSDQNSLDALAELAGVSTAPGSEPDSNVMAMLDLSDKGRPLSTIANTFRVLSEDPRWASRLHFNAFENRDYLDGQLITDIDATHIAIQLDQQYKLRPSRAELDRAIAAACARRTVHPVQAYLDGLTWDGRPRLKSWLANYLGAAQDPIVSELGLRWCIGAVARIREPGCKMDNNLVLVGAQGIGKSQACRALMPDPNWFCDTCLPLGNKDAALQIQGVWVHEIPEMHSLLAAGNSKAKAFLTRQDDRFRKPYARRIERFDRQVVFISTINERAFLTDATGSRRFWPVEVTRVDLDGLRSVRDQLWAEADHRYRKGESWWLTNAWEARLREASKAFAVADAWDRYVLEWAESRDAPFTVDEVLSGALGIAPDRMTRAAQSRVGKILTAEGYEKRRPRGGARTRVYVPRKTSDRD